MKFLVIILAVVALSACTEKEGHRPGTEPTGPSTPMACVDHDGDGFGDGCDNGHDCNDTDKSIHHGCLQCALPSEGCACKDGSKPQSCFLSPTQNDDGAVMCHEGTRYCRSGAWSSCESIFNYQKPPAAETQGVIDPSGAPVHCSDCNVNCFVIHDNLDPIDGGLTDANAQAAEFGDGGGITLQSTVDAAAPDTYVFDPSTCIVGTAPDHDCDGIPDKYDPYPLQKPFATANPTIFLDIGPGESETGVVDLAFYLNSADVYFLVDQSGSMEDERARLQTDLVTGDFINDASYECSDFDFDFHPNNEQKTKGLIGAIQCIIRDANFGAGLFREIPFSAYAPTDEIAFRNYADISTNTNTAIAAIAKFATVGNNDWPEADTLALYSVVTGEGMYFGTTKPGIPARTGCPAGTYGYPCFRNDAIPIVVLFTDAMLHNGPSNNAYAYSAASLGMTKGTTTTLAQLTATNETFATAADLGTVNTSYTTFQGDTTSMVSNLTHTEHTCSSSSSTTGPDALFKFSVTGSTATTVSLTTEGSEFDTSLALYRGFPMTATTVPSYPNTNDVGSNAYAFGSVSNQFVKGVGNTSTLVADYSPTDVGCASDVAGKDAVFNFTLAQPTRVALDSAGSAFGTVVSLFSAAPPKVTYTAVTNTNDTVATAYNAGEVFNSYKGFSGDSSVAGITANYTGAQVGCSAADTATDAVYQFTLAQPTRVRLSAVDSTAVKPVVSLFSAGNQIVTPVSLPNTNDTQATAYSIGDMTGKALQISGSSASLVANYASATVGCSAADAAQDAVFKFTLPSTKTLQMDTDGSSFDTVLSLFNATVASDATPVMLASNANENGLSVSSLGVVDGVKYVVSGGSSATMANDYNTAQIGCGSSTASGDAAFKFHVNTTRTVRIDSVGSSFDTVLSLHNGLLPDPTVTTIATNTNENVASAQVIATAVDNTNVRYDGNSTSMTADIPIDDGLGCSANAAAPDAVFKFTVNAPGTYELNTEGSSFDTVLGLFPSPVIIPTASGPTSKGSFGEAKFPGTKPASTVTMGDGRAEAAASPIDMTSATRAWVVATANINGATINPSPQGINLVATAITPASGLAESIDAPQSLGTVEQRKVTVTDSFTSAINNHSSTSAWNVAACSDATAKTGVGLDRVYKFTPTQNGTVRATMKATAGSATSYTMGVFTSSPALVATDWKDKSNFSAPSVTTWPNVVLNTTTCPSVTDIVINTSGVDAATIFPDASWCSGVTKPAFAVQTQTSFSTGAPQIMVISFTGLTVGAGRTLHLVGDKPAVLAVYGDAAIDGTIDASAFGSTYPIGAGGNVSCTAGVGTGIAGNASGTGASGGSGGGFGKPGGSGAAGFAAAAVSGGQVEGTSVLRPLRAGCKGGAGGSGAAVGGNGGGAVQLTVTGTLTAGVSGVIQSLGSGGAPATGTSHGGAGGGSGGAVLVEYGLVSGSLTTRVEGGSGGGGRGNSGTPTAGNTGSTTGALGGTGASGGGAGGVGGFSGAAGSNGVAGVMTTNGGGGGGGGGVGYATTRALTASTWAPSNIVVGTAAGQVNFTTPAAANLTVPAACTVTITTAAVTTATLPTFAYSGCGAFAMPAGQVVHPAAAPGAEKVAVFAINDFFLPSSSTIRLVSAVANSMPVIFAAQGNVHIDGTIDAHSAKNTTYGAGSNPTACATTGNGGTGTTGTAADDKGDPGGGGGGGILAGFAGGLGSGGGAAAGSAGAASNASAVTAPLKGGCPGGSAKNAGGYGGGAFQISAKGTLAVSKSGTLTAAGGGGIAGNTATGEDGGSGGGSGGMIFLEARSYGAQESGNGASLRSNGGGGGGACSTSSCTGATDGSDGLTTSSAAVGGNAVTGGGAGGNGGVSVINGTPGTNATVGGSGTGITYPPAVNITTSQWSFVNSPTWNCNASGTTTIDSAAATITSTSCTLGTLDFTNNVTQDLSSGGPTAFVVRLRGLTLSSSHVLRLVGDKPIVIMVDGNVLVDGTAKIDAGSNTVSTLGSGANWSGCGTSIGTAGASGANGGGGGGFKTVGGSGGLSGAGAAGGVLAASTTLQPLRGGCAGGRGGSTGGLGGYGGGAFQISSSGTLTIGTSANTPNLSAAGGGGGATSTAGTGGGGGGSGGGILLVAPAASATIGGSAGLRAHGGAGSKGRNSSGGSSSNAASDGSATTNTAAATSTNGNGAGGPGGLCAGVDCTTSGAGSSTVTVPGAGGGGSGVVRYVQSANVAVNGGNGAGAGGGGGSAGVVVTSGFSGNAPSASGISSTYDLTSAATYCATGTNTVAGTVLEWNVVANQVYYVVAKETVAANADAFTLDMQWAGTDWPGVSEDRYADDVFEQFSFTGGGTRPFTIDTQSTGFNAVLALYSDPGTPTNMADDTSLGYAYNNVGGYSSISATLSSGTTYYAIVRPLIGASLTTGTVNLGIRDDQNAGAIDVGTIDNSWPTFTGTTSAMTDDSNFNSCGANASSRDAFYKFHVEDPNGDRSITIDMTGTGFDAVLGLYKWDDDSYVTCNHASASDGSPLITAALDPGDYYVVIKGNGSSDRGSYKIAFKDNNWLPNVLQCNDNGGAAGVTSKITRALTAGTYYAVVKGKVSTNKGTYRLNIKDTAWTGTPNRLSCNDDTAVGNTASTIEQSLIPGDYYVVVKGHGASDIGSYVLTVQDRTTLPSNPFIDCNDDHATINTSSLTKTLNAGTYYLTVKGKSSSASGAYTLNMRDTVVTTPATLLQCDYNSGPSSTALLERDLVAGTYNVVVKGKLATDKGAYKIAMRDVTSLPSNFLQCDHTSGTGSKSYLERDLSAGTYTVVLKGDAAAASGVYNLSVRDASNISTSSTPIGCNDDYDGSHHTSRLSQSLIPGSYYAAIKGYSGTDKGRYQLSVGGAATTAATYVPPTWSQTLAKLQEKKVRVMSVLSCQDDPSHGDTNNGDCNLTRAQATTLANNTDAVGYNSQPLVFNINGDGSGLSKTVVDGVSALAKYLEMNVSVRVVFDPDANPGFQLVVSAVDQAGDGCDGLIGIEHQHCKPGATPRFHLAFTNPAGGPVPLNPADPNGGYNFRAELIANNQFIVDRVPIYIIPKNVTHLPPEPMFAPHGTYWQNVPSPGCTGNDLPDWRDLTWNADVPNGTSVVFKVCTAAKVEDFPSCTYTKIATVTGGPTCMTDSNCNMAAGAYCASAGNCQTITSGTCMTDVECPSGAHCIAHTCTFASQPVYVGSALAGGGNFKSYLRMQIDMNSNTALTAAPAVHDWSLTYLCNSSL